MAYIDVGSLLGLMAQMESTEQRSRQNAVDATSRGILAAGQGVGQFGRQRIRNEEMAKRQAAANLARIRASAVGNPRIDPTSIPAIMGAESVGDLGAAMKFRPQQDLNPMEKERAAMSIIAALQAEERSENPNPQRIKFLRDRLEAIGVPLPQTQQPETPEARGASFAKRLVGGPQAVAPTGAVPPPAAAGTPEAPTAPGGDVRLGDLTPPPGWTPPGAQAKPDQKSLVRGRIMKRLVSDPVIRQLANPDIDPAAVTDTVRDIDNQFFANILRNMRAGRGRITKDDLKRDAKAFFSDPERVRAAFPNTIKRMHPSGRWISVPFVAINKDTARNTATGETVKIADIEQRYGGIATSRKTSTDYINPGSELWIRKTPTQALREMPQFSEETINEFIDAAWDELGME